MAGKKAPPLRLRLAVHLAACLAALTPTAWPAEAQDDEQPRWFSNSYDDMAMLGYGVPHSDYVMAFFVCGPGARFVKAGVQDEQSGARAGERQQVRLAAGGRQVEFSDHGLPNEDSGGVGFEGQLPLDDALRHILGASGNLDVTIKGHTQSYPLAGVAEPAAAMLAVCDAPKPPGDLDVTVTNKAKLPLQSFSWSEAGVNAFDSDAFGYRPLYPGASRTFTIRGGRSYAISADHRVFVWATHNRCGDELMTEQDDSQPVRFCLAHLPG